MAVLESQSLVACGGKAEHGLVPMMDRQYPFCSYGSHHRYYPGIPRISIVAARYMAMPKRYC
jgi:hypothetical protein